jgi:hypothetical protein
MKTNKLTILVASLGFAASSCATDESTPTEDNTPPPGSTSGNEDTTFDHDNSGFNPFDLIDRLAKEGPPKFTARVHSCSKVRYRTFGNVLTSLGVNITDVAMLSAGQLYTSGNNAMGAPNYANRIRENLNITTSGASREFDIFAAAAQTIIDGIADLPRCGGGGPGLGGGALIFDGNSCRADGITCLIGVPATAAHLDFCNLTVTSASDAVTGKRIAVAALLAAAYTCE